MECRKSILKSLFFNRKLFILMRFCMKSRLFRSSSASCDSILEAWGFPNKCSMGTHIHCLPVLSWRNYGYPHALLATTDTDHIFTSAGACGFEKAEVNSLRRCVLPCTFDSALPLQTAVPPTADDLYPYPVCIAAASGFAFPLVLCS